MKGLSKIEVLALRGLRLPAVALKGLQRAGIYCQPAISIEFQQQSRCYVIRGVESGGALPRLGAYCAFVGVRGGSLHSPTCSDRNGQWVSCGHPFSGIRQDPDLPFRAPLRTAVDSAHLGFKRRQNSAGALEFGDVSQRAWPA